MAAEFYRKSSALYEEFKRRELHYFNVERSINNSCSVKNDASLPLQDYLERLNRREKESERSYKDLLKHIDKMGKQTDQMSLKLDKLNALRNAAFSSNVTLWNPIQNSTDRSFEYQYRNSFQENYSTPPQFSVNKITHNIPTFEHSTPRLNCRSESTQTEHIFCEKCHYPFTRNLTQRVPNSERERVNLNETVSNELLTSKASNSSQPFYSEIGLDDRNDGISNSSCEVINRKEAISKECQGDYLPSLNSNQEVFKEYSKSSNPSEEYNLEHTTAELLQDPTQYSTAVTNTMFNDKLVVKDSEKNLNLNVERPSLSIHRELEQSVDFYNAETSLTGESSNPLDARISEEAIRIAQVDQIKDQTKQNLISDTTLKNFVDKKAEKDTMEDSALSKSEILEKAVSKSDDESINHEFDFLESDGKPSIKNKTFEKDNSLTDNKSIHIHENTIPNNNDEKYLLERNSTKNHTFVQESSISNSAINKNTYNTKSFNDTADSKLDSSLSEGIPSPAHHSADISENSESESISEKETPFTESAAYRALVSNVPVSKSIQKAPEPTESDSEDEIENAVKTVVRKSSNINFDAILQVQKKEEKKENASEVIPLTEKRTSKPVSVGNTQNKLSKNTRKVLGLDTSSGSEIELEAKPAVNKIDEDSDEFDFYN